jgi:hypothetical protein
VEEDKYNNITDEELLRDVEGILQHPELLDADNYKEALQIKKELLDTIQEKLIKDRRKKLYKLKGEKEPVTVYKVKSLPNIKVVNVPLVREPLNFEDMEERILERNHVDSDEDRIALLAIELATQLKYGSPQSRRYLEEAKMKLMKEKNKK